MRSITSKRGNKIMKQEILFQKIEMLVLFVSATIFYFWLNFSVWIFAVLLFSFDISMIGYLKNNKAGAILYNIGHSLVLPISILTFAMIFKHNTALAFSLIWLAHIGLDRFLGYGLKLTTGFKETHLGKIGE